MSTRPYQVDYRSILSALSYPEELAHAAVAIDLGVLARRKRTATRAFATVSAARAPPAYDISIRVAFRHPMNESAAHEYHLNVINNITPVVGSIFTAVPPSEWFEDPDGNTCAPNYLPWLTECSDMYHIAKVSLRPEVSMPSFGALSLELIRACAVLGPVHQISYKPRHMRRWQQLI